MERLRVVCIYFVLNLSRIYGISFIDLTFVFEVQLDNSGH